LKQTDPGGGREKWLISVSAVGLPHGTLILYDRLLHVSGFDGTNTGAQAVGGAITRNTGGVGNHIWIEIYTATGSSVTTISASYTDQDGNSGQTTPNAVIGGAAAGRQEQARILPLSLATGDTGVQAVASVTLAGSTGTVGDFGVTIARPLLYIPCATRTGRIHDLVAGYPGICEIDENACLAWAVAPTDTGSIVACISSANFVEK
jgi:hypothetical protein